MMAGPTSGIGLATTASGTAIPGDGAVGMIEAQAEVLLNYVGGEWTPSQSGAKAPVRNPATSETIALVPLSPAEEVDQAVAAAMKAYPEWRETPVVDRIKPLFKLRDLLTAH